MPSPREELLAEVEAFRVRAEAAEAEALNCRVSVKAAMKALANAEAEIESLRRGQR